MREGEWWAERERQEERESEKPMKTGQERRGTLTSAAPLVLVEVVTRAAAARVGPMSTDTVVLTAVSPICTGIDGCRGTGHPSPSCPILPRTAKQGLLQGFEEAPSTLRQEGKVPRWWPDQLIEI